MDEVELEACEVCGYDKVVGVKCWACPLVFAGEDGR